MRTWIGAVRYQFRKAGTLVRHIGYNAADPIKAAAQRAAKHDNCGVASFIPVLIRNHCKSYEISVEKENPQGENRDETE